MAQYKAVISRVITNGPFTYILYKDGVGTKAVTNVATIAAALDGVKADVGALLGAEVVQDTIILVNST